MLVGLHPSQLTGSVLSGSVLRRHQAPLGFGTVKKEPHWASASGRAAARDDSRDHPPPTLLPARPTSASERGAFFAI